MVNHNDTRIDQVTAIASQNKQDKKPHTKTTRRTFGSMIMQALRLKTIVLLCALIGGVVFIIIPFIAFMVSDVESTMHAIKAFLTENSTTTAFVRIAIYAVIIIKADTLIDNAVKPKKITKKARSQLRYALYGLIIAYEILLPGDGLRRIVGTIEAFI